MVTFQLPYKLILNIDDETISSLLFDSVLDRPQVQATCRYLARQPDELSLEEGDVITVIKKHKKDGQFLPPCFLLPSPSSLFPSPSVPFLFRTFYYFQIYLKLSIPLFFTVKHYHYL